MGGAQTDRQPQPSGKGGHAGPCSAEAGVWEGSLGGAGRGQDLLSQGGGGWVACGGKGCGPRRPALPYLLANLKDRFLQRQTEEKGDVGGEGRGPGQSHPPPPHPEGGRCPGTPSPPPPQMGRGSAGGSRHLGGSNPPHLPTPVTPSHMGQGGGHTRTEGDTEVLWGGGVPRGWQETWGTGGAPGDTEGTYRSLEGQGDTQRSPPTSTQQTRWGDTERMCKSPRGTWGDREESWGGAKGDMEEPWGGTRGH